MSRSNVVRLRTGGEATRSTKLGPLYLVDFGDTKGKTMVRIMRFFNALSKIDDQDDFRALMEHLNDSIKRAVDKYKKDIGFNELPKVITDLDSPRAPVEYTKENTLEDMSTRCKRVYIDSDAVSGLANDYQFMNLSDIILNSYYMEILKYVGDDSDVGVDQLDKWRIYIKRKFIASLSSNNVVKVLCNVFCE